MRWRPFPMLARTILLLGLLCCIGKDAWPLHPSTALDRYNRQSWSTENGLPQDSVHAMLQTTDGYLWLATEGGLARFDGYQFRVFDRDSTPGLPGNDVLCLFEDRSGALWIGTTSGLTRMKDGAANTYTTANGLPSNAIRSMLQSQDGALWVLTAGGLASVPATDINAAKLKFHTYTVLSGLLDDHVNAIAEAPEGGMWVGTARGLNIIRGNDVQRGPMGTTAMSIDALVDGGSATLLFASTEGVIQLSGGSVSVLAKPESLPSGGVQTLLKTPGGIWATGKNGATLIQPHSTLTFMTGHALPGSQIQTISLDSQGAVWIGTNEGLARWWNGKMKMEIAGDRGNHTSAILSLYEDREGDLWIGTETAGVTELRDRVFEMVGHAQGLVEETTTSVVESRQRRLWIGTNGGGLNFIARDGRHRIYTAKDGLASDTVLALANGQGADDIWVGTPDGLTHLQKYRASTYGPADGLADDFVRSLLSARDGTLWVGTRHGVSHWEQGQATNLTVAQGLGSDLVGAMLEDAAGDLWIGTLGGLSRIHKGGLTNFTTASGLPSNVITALETDSDGNLWAGTNGQGLALREGERFISFAAATSLPHTIYSILDDRRGALWLSSDRGLDRVSIETLKLFRTDPKRGISMTHFGTADGLASLEGADVGHPSAWRMAEGRLCFATRRGIAIVDPARLPATDAPPPVVIEQNSVDDREVTPQYLASLAPGPSHFAFTFAGISLTSPQRVQYRYMLQGFDRDWIDAGTRRTAYYTNIPHGRYRFLVSARNAGGSWSDSPAFVEMELRPHFYQTFWFRLLLLVLFAATLFGLYQLRVQALKSRFDAVSAERNRLAREVHDTLAQGFVAVSVRLEILSQILRNDRIQESREQLNETRTLVRDGLAEARRAIWNLRSEGGDSQTLPARLARSVQEAKGRGVKARLETTGTYRPLDSLIEDQLYRIAQESIANALRHANADNLRVDLTYSQELLVLEVTDDGNGFETSSAPSHDHGHFGLTGIKERAREIGAAIMLESAAGRGTTVRAELPLALLQKTRASERGKRT